MAGAGFRWQPAAMALAAVLWIPACRKPAEAVRSDLEEAGYRVTGADWMRAAGADDVEALRKFLAGGFRVDTRDDKGDSALHAAAFAGAERAADVLLDSGLEVDAAGEGGRTPLMAAVMADRAGMVRWLLRQGADPRRRDQQGFSPMMLAVREGKVAALAELAAVHGDRFDSAILLAALVGREEVIDTLSSFGASVHARMEDGRTTLMVAAENGHAGAVKLLIELGATRFSTDGQGRTAADLALAAGHPEVAALIMREPQPDELVLETEAQMAEEMTATLDLGEAGAAGGGVVAESEAAGGSGGGKSVPTLLDGQILAAAGVGAERVSLAGHERVGIGSDSVAGRLSGAGAGGRQEGNQDAAGSGAEADGNTSGAMLAGLPPLVMRQYRQRELPVRVRGAEAGEATIELLGSTPRVSRVAAGQTVPGSRLVVVRVDRRMVSSKENFGREVEVSVVEVRDPVTGVTREWITGQEVSSHDPVALLEDRSTGGRYVARAGARFRTADGHEFVISDVRPDQIVVEDAATGAVQTLNLRGPRG